jgi:hypothetical protein
MLSLDKLEHPKVENSSISIIDLGIITWLRKEQLTNEYFTIIFIPIHNLIPLENWSIFENNNL